MYLYRLLKDAMLKICTVLMVITGQSSSQTMFVWWLAPCTVPCLQSLIINSRSLFLWWGHCCTGILAGHHPCKWHTDGASGSPAPHAHKGNILCEELSSLLSLQPPVRISRVRRHREWTGRRYGVMQLIRSGWCLPARSLHNWHKYKTHAYTQIPPSLNRMNATWKVNLMAS